MLTLYKDIELPLVFVLYDMENEGIRADGIKLKEYGDKLAVSITELEKKIEEYDELDDLVKKQRIYISSNYEAYLGKEFINVDKLSELNSIMKSDSADTIAQALAVYNNRH